MTTEEMAQVLDELVGELPADKSDDEARFDEALKAGAAALRAGAKLEHLAEGERYGVLIHHQTNNVEWRGVGIGLASRSLMKALTQLPAPPEGV